MANIWNLTEINGESWKGNAFIKFKRAELRGIPSEFRKVFNDCGNEAHITKSVTPAGVEYEIRFIRYGYKIVVSGQDLAALKVEFVQMAIKAQRVEVVKPVDLKELQQNFAELLKAVECGALPILQTKIDEAATAKLYAAEPEKKEVA